MEHIRKPRSFVLLPKARRYYSWWVDGDRICGNIREQVPVCEKGVIPKSSPDRPHSTQEMALLAVRGDS